MKLATLFLFVNFIQISATVFSQNERFTFKADKIQIRELLDKIESESTYKFLYRSEYLNSTLINVDVQNLSLDELLSIAFNNTDITYKMLEDNLVVITPKVFAAAFQQHKITGKITDAVTGEALTGVNISIEGTTIGVITDINGNFTIEVPNENSVLLISYVGYLSENIIVGGQSNIDVKLSPDIKKLDEVVVVGYGKQKKSDLTGSVASANLEDFKKSPNTNIVQSLQGTVPGLNIGQVTMAGATPSISIRGANTISGNSDVLIILDGIQYNSSLSSINPDDIASIDVLKDASSTAVYGAQAANGVLLITTKKGTNNQKPKITFSSSYTTQTPTVGLRPLKKQGYLDHVRDLYWDQAYLSDGTLDPNFNVVTHVDIQMKDSNGNLLENDFDWWDAATKAGNIFDNQINVNGGGEKINYLVSFGSTEQSGFIVNDKFKRKSVRVNLESQVKSWWKLGIQSFGSFVNQDGAEPTLSMIAQGSPLISPYDSNGNLIPNPYGTVDLNPFLTYDVDDYERHNYLFLNIYSEIDIPFIKGLKYRFNYGNNYRIDKHYQASQYGAGLTGEAFKQDSVYHDYTFDNILTYERSFGKHNISTTLLYGAVKRELSSTYADAQGFSRLTLGYNSLEQANNQYTSSDAWKESLNYQMARLNYKYAYKYLMTATIRRDGFSGFAANKKYAYFPSFAVGWILSEESFFKVKGIDFLKVRAGYGVSGNQTSRYKSLARVTTQNAYIFGDGGSTLIGQELNSLANPDLKWEKTKGINAGLDFKLFQGRISGSIDLYSNTTNDLLFDVAIPNISGFSTISTNVGQLQNRGLEIVLTSRNIDYKNFHWNTTVNFTTNANKIVKLTGADANNDGKEDDMVASGLFIGEPTGAIYGYQVNGIYQLGETPPAGYYTGTYRIVDQDGEDYEITPDDRIILGHTEPAYRISILNKIEYKGFTLSVFLNSIQGGKRGYLGNNTRATSRSDVSIRFNNLDAINYWSPGNPDGEYPQSVSNPTVQPTVYRDRSFIRLQDITLSYQFKGYFIKKLNIEDLSLFVSGKNLATWTKWKGWDPETGQGLINDGRPVMKGYSIGCNVTF